MAVDAARVRATLGEISSALESVWGRHVSTTQVVQGAYSATYNNMSSETSAHETEWQKEYRQVLDDVEKFSQKWGRRPRILVAKMGMTSF